MMENSYESDFPRNCDFCRPFLTFTNGHLFAQHLRQVHCDKRETWLICRYGPNGLCQVSSLECLSNHEYEAHLKRFHVVKEKVNDSNKHLTPEQCDDKERNAFTVRSFTQNLSSVLSDPRRSRSEAQTFFTRHWGESFVPKTRFANSSSIPIILIEHFKKYLDTVAKKHQDCLKATSRLNRAYARHEENARIDVDDIPSILLSPNFSLADPIAFEAVFLEPVDQESDYLSVSGMNDTISLDSFRQESSVSCNKIFDDSLEGIRDRRFRSYEVLKHRLEYFHDLVDMRLNNQLASKSNAFWKTVVSYGGLSAELELSIEKIATIRKNLQRVKENIYEKMTNIVEMYKAKQNREQLFSKLQDMACLRDAQGTVQMLLNQNDYPKALECIETTQEVLMSDLRGVHCFRHLNSQLQELYKVIARMLQEEFVTLIQKELGRTCDNEAEILYQGGHLNPVILGLLRVQEYRFISVLQQEIVEDMKNCVRQVIKSYVSASVLEHESNSLDPVIGSLSNQLRALNFEQWLHSFKHTIHVLFCKCRRIQSLQELFMDNIDRYLSSARLSQRVSAESSFHKCNYDAQSDIRNGEALAETIKGVEKIRRICRTDSSSSVATAKSDSELIISNDERCGSATAWSESLNEKTPLSEVPSFKTIDPSSVLSANFSDISQVRQSISLIMEYSVQVAQERICKILMARAKDGSLEKLSLTDFHSVLRTVDAFISKCNSLVDSGRIYSLPLHSYLVQQSSCFVKRFHDDRKAKLSNILDSENWRAAEIPEHFLRLISEAVSSGRLSDTSSADCPETSSGQVLIVDGEEFIVVGTVLILLQMLSQYCDALIVLPKFASELLMCVVELLKSYNSRSCQLILGAGALQLVGLKSISVRHLALSSRCLQLILKFIPYLVKAFEKELGEDKHKQFRYFNQVIRDYNDHVQEIVNKLINVINHHIMVQLQTWEVKGSVPSPTFQHICKQLGKFYNGLTGIMPEGMIKELFLNVHADFKKSLKERMEKMDITPHNSLSYGLVSQEYLFYIKSLQSMPCCADLTTESISEALYAKPQ